MVTMNGMEPLQRLFFRSSEMIQEVSDSFEQHFLWLEEVVAEARQTLASPDLVLLPKTPSAAPGRTRRLLKEDAENFPPPASSMPARRGRLCSKLAFEKIQEQGRMSKVKKLRRPSSPMGQAHTTTHKSDHHEVSPSVSRSVGEPGESPAPECERVIPSSPSSSRGSCQQSRKLVVEPREPNTSQKDTSSPKKYLNSLQKDDNLSQEDPVSTEKNDSSPQNDDSISPMRKVTFQQKENCVTEKDGMCQDHSSPQAKSSSPPMGVISPHKRSSSKENVSKSPDSSAILKDSITFQSINNQKKISEKATQEGDSSDSSQNTTKATVVSQVLPQEEEEFHLQLDESFDECAPVDYPEEKQDIEVLLESPKMQKSKNAIIQSNPLGPEISNTEQTEEDPALPNSLPQPPSIPAPRVTCINQEIFEVENTSPLLDTLAPSCSAPASRITRTKQRAMEVIDAPPFSESLPQSPSVPAPRITRTKQKVTKVQDVPPLSDSLPQLSAVPATRITRTKQRAIEVQDVPLSPESIPQPPSAPAPRVTRTKQKAILNEIPPSSPILPQPVPRITRTKQKAKELEPPPSPQETCSKKLGSDEEEETKSMDANANLTHQHHLQEGDDKDLKTSDVKDSEVFSLRVKMDGWGSAESLSSGESCPPPTHLSTPPMRITRSKMSKLQRPQHSPEKALPTTQNFQRSCCSPRGTVLPQSPCKESSVTRKLAVHLDRDGGKEHLGSEVLHSPVRVVRHSPDKTGKVVHPRLPVVSGSSGRITPNLISRMQPFLTASSSSSSSSASTEHRRIIKRTAGTPNEGRRPVNNVTGLTSFIKSQPARPTREEIEDLRIQELQRKKEYEEETLRKKEQLLLAKTEERKRCNEERMRRAKEARLKKDQLAAAAKEQQKRERQQREARQREEEEQQRRLRQQQLAKKKIEEETKKAAKLKEEEERKKQEEEERRKKKLEEEKRRQKLEEENRKKLEEERRNYLAEQKIVLEKQRQLKMAKAQMLVKEKEEAEQLRLKESLRILREKELQAKREQEAKAIMSSTYIYKENTYTTPASTTSTNKTSSGNLNTTYTKSGGSAVATVKADSYEMTPIQPKRTSSSLNNYNINDLQSDDSTDDDSSPKKKIPQWAMKTQMRAALLQQEHYPPKVDNIFPPSTLLVLPDLSQIFPKQKRRFRKRTSSAIWETPPSKFFRVTSPM